MQVYIVGGAVRDQLMNRPIKDKDFMVVGATPEQMIKKGFIQVGADFPVFLHPVTKSEYALARTERKSGKGYKGFEIYAAPEVTLEQDLKRRDLTINAMAIEVNGLNDDTPKTGEVIDPYGGIEDIKNKILRHVSSAFSEDPLRILRIARFYGRFYDATAPANFVIAPETKQLIQSINQTDELSLLTAERVWQETSRAMMQQSPQAYFECLIAVNSLPSIMPNVSRALTDTCKRKFIFKALSLAGQHDLNLAQRWTILMLCHSDNLLNLFSKSLTAPKLSLSKLEHWNEQHKLTSNRLKLPKKITQFTSSYINCFQYLVNDSGSSAQSIADVIRLTKADKNMSELYELLTVHKIIELAYQQYQLASYIDAYNSVSIQDIDNTLRGSAIGEALQLARIDAIENVFINNQVTNG